MAAVRVLDNSRTFLPEDDNNAKFLCTIIAAIPHDIDENKVWSIHVPLNLNYIIFVIQFLWNIIYLFNNYIYLIFIY